MKKPTAHSFFVGVGIAAVLTIFFFFYLNLESIDASSGVSEFVSTCLTRLIQPHNIALVVGGLAIGSIVFSAFVENKTRCLDFIYRFRWLLALTAIALCTLFNISGSSLGWWYDGTGWDGTLLGTARSCRSDEFLVNTPMAFAQFFNDAGAWPYFGETFRGTLSDMFIIYGQPVADPAVLLRPFHWGYLLFGAEQGLAFFWCARVIILFMCTFEVGMLVSNKRKGLAVGLALLVTFCPVLCWWLDVNGYVEMIVSCEAMFLIVACYMRTTSYRLRVALGLPFVIAGGCFILTFYPALQVPMAYLFFVMTIAYIATHRKRCHFGRKDVALIGGFFLLFCLAMVYVFTKSWDTVQTVLNTAYPGHRIDCGGGALPLLAQYPLDALAPLRSFPDSIRMDAFASVYDFFPLGILITLWVVLKERTRDVYLIALLLLSIFLGLYCFVGFPEPLAKITLMSYSTGGLYSKAFIVFGFVNLLLLIRSVALLKAQPSRLIAGGIALVFTICLMTGSALIFTWFYSKAALIICAFVLALGIFLFLQRKDGHDGKLVFYLITLSLFMGVMVNPLQIGASPLLENQTRQAVASVNSTHPDSRWAVTGDNSAAYADLAATSGAAVINTCNVYPNLDLWRTFDPEGTFDEIYNRYAHISIWITEDKTHFGDAGFDSFTLYLNPNDVPLLKVNYLVSSQDLAQFSTSTVKFIPLSSPVSGRAIYEVQDEGN